MALVAAGVGVAIVPEGVARGAAEADRYGCEAGGGACLQQQASAVRCVAGIYCELEEAAASQASFQGRRAKPEVVRANVHDNISLEVAALAAPLAEHEIDRVRGDLPQLGLVVEGAFEHG